MGLGYAGHNVELIRTGPGPAHRGTKGHGSDSGLLRRGAKQEGVGSAWRLLFMISFLIVDYNILPQKELHRSLQVDCVYTARSKIAARMKVAMVSLTLHGSLMFSFRADARMPKSEPKGACHERRGSKLGLATCKVLIAGTGMWLMVSGQVPKNDFTHASEPCLEACLHHQA